METQEQQEQPDKLKLFATGFIRFWWQQDNAQLDEVYSDFIASEEGKALLADVTPAVEAPESNTEIERLKNKIVEIEAHNAGLEQKVTEINDIATVQLHTLEEKDKTIRSLQKKLNEKKNSTEAAGTEKETPPANPQTSTK